MSDKVYNVLFICTGNSARSIMAEGLMNALGKGRFTAYSAGSHPNGTVNPMALETLASFGVSTEGFRSKSWDEFATPESPTMHFVFTVCDNAAGEVCPVWHGQPVTAHWGVPDPAAFEGTTEQRRKRFFDVGLMLRRRIELLLALPVASLDRIALRKELKSIGSR